jgi:O-antigen/teichoic acid export membrane protein
MRRYLTSAVEQALSSLLNLGVNLLLIRLIAPEQYGAFALWAATAFILSGLQNALALIHLMVEPGDGFSEPRLSLERLMHRVNGLFQLVCAGGVLIITLTLSAAGNPVGAPAAALFIPAFLAQQYVRGLAFSRGDPTAAAVQTGAVLVLATILLTAGEMLASPMSANLILTLMAIAYGTVGILAHARATRGQGTLPWGEIGKFAAYGKQSGWVFLGVSTTELLARFYVFAVTAVHGPAALAALAATQLLLRPIPLLAASWSMVARADLVRRREAADWRGFGLLIALTLVGGTVVAAGWTALIHLAWAPLSSLVFNGKYADAGWMVTLWGVSALINFCQIAISIGLQVLKAFKPLAIANAAASIVAVGAILVCMHIWGPAGAITGTVIGQALELVVMAVLLIGGMRAAARAKGAAGA